MEQGTLTGTFSTVVRADCYKVPEPSEIGEGSLYYAAGGMGTQWGVVTACRYTHEIDEDIDYVLVTFLKACEEGYCPDTLMIMAKSSAIQAGVLRVGPDLRIEHDDYIDTTGHISAMRILSLGLAGTVTFSSASAQPGSAISGSVDAMMVRYMYEYCGDDVGEPCDSGTPSSAPPVPLLSRPPAR
jgi:hypothetical protein